MRILRLCVFSVLAATLAHADMVLQYSGLTAVGSSLAGNAVAVGTPFEIDFLFPATMVEIAPGIATTTSNVDAATIDVGGTSYSATFATTVYSVQIYDPSNSSFPGWYLLHILPSSGAGFGPAYTTATPPLDALNPIPTVFSDFQGDFGGASLTFDTAAGSLVVTYDPTTSLNTSIVSPEPGTFVLFGVAFAGIALLRRRA